MVMNVSVEDEQQADETAQHEHIVHGPLAA